MVVTGMLTCKDKLLPLLSTGQQQHYAIAAPLDPWGLSCVFSEELLRLRNPEVGY